MSNGAEVSGYGIAFGEGRWPLLADDMFRVAHEDRDGGRLLHPDVAALGLAAALLGELLLAGRVTFRAGHVIVLDRRPPLDALAHTVLDHLVGEAVAHPIRVWLTFVGRTAYTDVAQRLLRAGHVRTRASRRLFTTTTRYVPVNMNTAAWPWARLSTQLASGRELDAFDTVLGGLVLATDLHRIVLSGPAAEVTAQLRAVVAAAAPPVRELIEHTGSAVGATVITH
jgi:hypothetical protein